MEAQSNSGCIEERTGKVGGKGVQRGSGRLANRESRTTFCSLGPEMRIRWVVLLKSLRINGMLPVIYKADKVLTYLEYLIKLCV